MAQYSIRGPPPPPPPPPPHFSGSSSNFGVTLDEDRPTATFSIYNSSLANTLDEHILLYTPRDWRQADSGILACVILNTVQNLQINPLIRHEALPSFHNLLNTAGKECVKALNRWVTNGLDVYDQGIHKDSLYYFWYTYFAWRLDQEAQILPTKDDIIAGSGTPSKAVLRSMDMGMEVVELHFLVENKDKHIKKLYWDNLASLNITLATSFGSTFVNKFCIAFSDTVPINFSECGEFEIVEREEGNVGLI